jgi:RNA polymerase sigma factor (sigma-70 family)
MTVAEYNQCVDQYSDNVYRFILKNVRDDEMANDIVQDSFLKLWDKKEDISKDKVRSYLFTTAYHTMIDAIRKSKKTVSLNEKASQNFSCDNDYSDLKEVLNEAVERLPEIQRTVVLLRDYEGYSYEEIGEITRLNESQVKVYIYRARLFLKEYIGKLENVI